MTRRTSASAIQLIKDLEGYGKRLPDGSCTAYQEKINGKLDIPTIGYGCTKKVAMGTVWSEKQAEEQLLKELDIHERRVERLCTVELNQNQFDALVSFDFNTGGLTLSEKRTGKELPSGVLKAVNAGSFDDAADELKLWNKFGGKVAKGLVARRAAEIALFVKHPSAVDTDYMPQQVELSSKPLSKKVVAAATTVASAGAATVAQTGIPAPSPKVIDSVANVGAWKSLSGTMMADPILLVAIAGVAAVIVGPWLHEKLKG